MDAFADSETGASFRDAGSGNGLARRQRGRRSGHGEVRVRKVEAMFQKTAFSAPLLLIQEIECERKFQMP